MFQVSFDEDRLTEIVRQAVADAIGETSKVIDSPPIERKTLHSIRALSEFIGCSAVTAQKIKNSGRIPYRQVGRKVMFDTADVLKAMEQPKKKTRTV